MTCTARSAPCALCCAPRHAPDATRHAIEPHAAHPAPCDTRLVRCAHAACHATREAPHAACALLRAACLCLTCTSWGSVSTARSLRVRPVCTMCTPHMHPARAVRALCVLARAFRVRRAHLLCNTCVSCVYLVCGPRAPRMICARPLHIFRPPRAHIVCTSRVFCAHLMCTWCILACTSLAPSGLFAMLITWCRYVRAGV